MRYAFRQRAWIGAPLAAALATGILLWWGFAVWAALLIALLLVCPALMIWGIIVTRRVPDLPGEIPPETRGMTLNWIAPVYDWYCPKLGLGRAFRGETLRHAALRPGECVLEVGCGTGVITRLAAEAVGPAGRALGIDPAPKMIAIARRNEQKSGSRAQFRLAAIEALPFEDRSFDAAVASLMLHHLPSDLKRQGLREVFRVLKPGGRLVVVDLDRPGNPLWWLLVAPLLLMDMTAGNLRGEIPAFLAGAGFVQVRATRRWYQLLSFWTALKPSC